MRQFQKISSTQQLYKKFKATNFFRRICLLKGNFVAVIFLLCCCVIVNIHEFLVGWRIAVDLAYWCVRRIPSCHELLSRIEREAQQALMKVGSLVSREKATTGSFKIKCKL